MGAVVIKCSKTGAEVPTGIEMEQPIFDIAVLSGARLRRCPSCGGTHTWDKKDARIKQLATLPAPTPPLLT
jgi:hypothetical protein